MSHLNINGVDKPLDHIYVKARTENLALPMDIWLNGYVNTSGQISAQSATRLEKTSPLIHVDDSLTYSYSYGSNSGYFPEGDENVAWRAIACYDTDGVFLTRIGGNGRHPIITTDVNALPTGTAFIRLTLRTYGNNTNCMLNTGSTAKPYEPYLITKEAWEARTRVILHNLTNPLCGIRTYKDTLDLSTGTLTRYIKKLVLNGTENWAQQNAASGKRFNLYVAGAKQSDTGTVASICTHFPLTVVGCTYNYDNTHTINNAEYLYIRMDATTTLNSFKQYLAAQYSVGTPVTIWYVLATPETEQITVPSNLTGIVEGYLTQSSTPSPTSPVYPTANGTLEQGGTYSLDTGAYAIAWGRADTFTGTNSISARCYGLPIKSWEIDGNSQQDGTPTPDNPVYPEFVGEKTENLFDKSNADIYDNSTLATQNQWDYNPEYTGRVLRIPCNASTQYTISFNQELSNASLYRISTIDTDSVPTSGETGTIPCYTYYTSNAPITRTITTGVSAKYILLQINGQMMDSMCNALMINEGATPLPYEPYGWAIEIEVT